MMEKMITLKKGDKDYPSTLKELSLYLKRYERKLKLKKLYDPNN